MEVFVVLEHCAIAGECEDNFAVCKTYAEAKRIFDGYLEMELDPKKDGSFCQLQNKTHMPEDLVVTDTTDYYECWIHGDYARNHYKLALESRTI